MATAEELTWTKCKRRAVVAAKAGRGGLGLGAATDVNAALWTSSGRERLRCANTTAARKEAGTERAPVEEREADCSSSTHQDNTVRPSTRTY